MVRMELTSGSSNGQSNKSKNLPSGGITSPNAGGKTIEMGSSYAEWRSLYYTVSAHYSYKSRYTIGFDMRVDGTTKFGPDKRWGCFPAVNTRWNMIDENFMETLRDRAKVSMLSARFAIGRSGHAPKKDYLYTSEYGGESAYLGYSAKKPIRMQLNTLRWEIVNSMR